jgi:hypothetical protein
MSRPWPLLIVTQSGILHISDAQNAENDSDYDCRCGRTLNSRGCSHYSIDTSGEEELSDEFSTGEYKTRRRWFFKGGIRLCSKCGTPEDFDAAVDKYRLEQARYREETDAADRRRRDIRKELEKRAGSILTQIALSDCFDREGCKVGAFDVSLKSGTLKFTVDDFEFEIRVVNLGALVEAAEAEEASTECAGAHASGHEDTH